MEDHLIEFIKENTKKHDAAHNFDHAKEVVDLMIEIAARQGLILSTLEEQLLPYIGGLHDINDHKLAERGLCVGEKAVKEYLIGAGMGGYADEILYIHNNCSWSKRLTRTHSKIFARLHALLEDADWSLATGNTGITRCAEYSATYFPNAHLTDRVCEHIREKMLLIPAQFNFAATRQMTSGAIAELEYYLAQYEKK